MPCEIQDVLNNSHISTAELFGDSDYLLTKVTEDLEHLVTEHQELIEIAESDDHDEIANYAQDRITTLTKQIWMLKSTLS